MAIVLSRGTLIGSGSLIGSMLVARVCMGGTIDRLFGTGGVALAPRGTVFCQGVDLACELLDLEG